MKIKESLTILVVFVIVFTSSYYFLNKSIFKEHSTTNITNFKGGKFINLVYVGSNNCAFCNDDLHLQIKRVDKIIREKLKNSTVSYMSTGVSVDLNTYEGYNFLDNVLAFDEMVVGAGWYNIAADKFLWGDMGNEAAVPLILILKTDIDVISSLEGILEINKSETLIKKMESLRELKDFNEEEAISLFEKFY